MVVVDVVAVASAVCAQWLSAKHVCFVSKDIYIYDDDDDARYILTALADVCMYMRREKERERACCARAVCCISEPLPS